MEVQRQLSINSRNDFIDFLKGVLIILVVYGHVIQFIEYKHTDEYWNDYIFKLIYIFHMPMFMLISGYLSFSSIEKHSFSDLMFRRFNQLLVPVFIWGTLVGLQKSMFEHCKSNVFSLDFMFFVIKKMFSELSHGFWFLWVLFISISIVLFVKKLRASAFSLIITIFALFLIPDVWHFHLLKYTYPYFVAGYLLCQFGFSIQPKPFYKGKIIAIVLFLACLFFYSLWDKSTYIYVSKMEVTKDNISVIFFRYLSGAVFCFSFVFFLSWLFPLIKKYTITILKMGRNSMAIYVLQGYIIDFLVKVSFYDDYILNVNNIVFFMFSMSVVFFINHTVNIVNRFSISKYLFGIKS